MTESEVHALAERLLAEHGLSQQDWSFKMLDRESRGYAGICFFYPRVIVLYRDVALNTADQNVREALLHEIAHALCRPNSSHNQAWYDKLTEIGGTGVWHRNDGQVRKVIVDRMD